MQERSDLNEIRITRGSYWRRLICFKVIGATSETRPRHIYVYICDVGTRLRGRDLRVLMKAKENGAERLRIVS